VFYVGLDLGQRRDHTAIAVLERWDAERAFLGAEMKFLEVRYLERVPLGTPYTRVVERVRGLVSDSQLAGQVALAVDATGVGAPVVDLLRSARLGCDVTAVSITGGDRVSQTGAVWNVPKRDLIAGVQVLLERGELKIARGLRDSWALVKELLDVRMISSAATGRVRMGADGGGEHDDLVIALALGCWRAGRKNNGFGTRRLV
jgi:hypothetical protein